MIRRSRFQSSWRAYCRSGALCVAVALSFSAAAAPQQQTGETTPQAASGGHFTIVLPPVLVAGQPATLAVLDAQGRPAANVQVSLGGDVTLITDATGRAALTAPDAPGILMAKLPDGTAEGSATVIPAPAEEPKSLRIDSAPRILLLRERCTIRGSGFLGVADQNRVLLGGQPAAVLAASPVAIVALANPTTALGEGQLAVETAGQSAATGPVIIIALEVTSDKAKGAPGEAGQIHVNVRGTDRPVYFEVRAEPAGRIELTRGNPARGKTSGGASNSAAIAFTFRQPGEFFLEVRQVQPPLGLPDTEAARGELEEARRLAPRGWSKQVERVLELVEKHPQDVAEARDAIEKMLAKKPSGEFGRHLEAAWHILLNRE